MHIASSSGNDAIVRCLIKHGARTDIRDYRGNLPAHMASKYVLDNFKLYKSHQDLLKPLIKGFPDGIDEKNDKGKTPVDYLNKAREKYEKFCLEDVSSTDSDSSESEEELFGTKRSFEELLAEEIAIECSKFESPFNDGYWDNVEEEIETFDMWAERMSREYARKHNHSKQEQQKPAKKRKLKKQQPERKTELQLIPVKELKLQKQHEMYKQKLEEAKGVKDKKLRYDDIPWPCLGSLKEMIEVIMKGVEKGADAKVRRKYVIRQMALWHSDKFKQKFDHLLHESDRKKILETVDNIFKELNNL